MKENDEQKLEILPSRPISSYIKPSIHANMNRDCPGNGRVSTPEELAEYLGERFKKFVPQGAYARYLARQTQVTLYNGRNQLKPINCVIYYHDMWMTAGSVYC